MNGDVNLVVPYFLSDWNSYLHKFAVMPNLVSAELACVIYSGNDFFNCDNNQTAE